LKCLNQCDDLTHAFLSIVVFGLTTRRRTRRGLHRRASQPKWWSIERRIPNRVMSYFPFMLCWMNMHEFDCLYASLEAPQGESNQKQVDYYEKLHVSAMWCLSSSVNQKTYKPCGQPAQAHGSPCGS
jgi:hypothetical protein